MRHVVILGLCPAAPGGPFIDEALARLAPGIALRYCRLEHVFMAAVAPPVDVGAISLVLALFLAGLESNDTLGNLRFRALAIRPQGLEQYDASRSVSLFLCQFLLRRQFVPKRPNLKRIGTSLIKKH